MAKLKKTRRSPARTKVKAPRKTAPTANRGYYDSDFGCRFSKDGWPLYPGFPLALRLK